MTLRRLAQSAALLVLAAAAGSLSLHAGQAPAPGAAAPASQTPTPPRPPVNDSRASVEDYERWMTELSNWGRWGKDDEFGAANLVTATKRKQALALAKTGETVSLSHNPIMDKDR